MSTGKTAKAVVVTTDKRGVFFGYLVGSPSKERVKLRNARNCVYWSKDVRGFLGLTQTGPTATCRIGVSTPELTLFGITSVAVCTEMAVKAWEQAPWKS